ncbi:MAG: glycogen/starch/alpha-glucan family phosphorylase [Clostridia bacterium]|nr:glycogen/starch/alpha-glucan family phosphorylase [Clostridia bacterium]
MDIRIDAWCREAYGRGCDACEDHEIYRVLTEMTQRLIRARREACGQAAPQKKKLYYLCAEFLMGRLLRNHLINLGVYEEVKAQLQAAGKDIALIEEQESEPSLGNGGLGRLAACFLDSIATLGLAGDGVGLCYHLGLFRQVFCDCKQTEQPNPWLDGAFPLHRTERSHTIECMGRVLTSRMYDMDVMGYGGHCNRLHLFDVESVREDIVREGIAFDPADIVHNLTLFLYPDDSTHEGRQLRLCQQYFMVYNAAQLILDESMARGCTLHDLADYAVIQINDTHPALILPVLVRELEQRGIAFGEAMNIVRRCCAYTNHTVMAEALEQWSLSMLRAVAPPIVPVLERMNDAARAVVQARGGAWEACAIIDAGERVHMARLAVHFCFSVNGVAALHSRLLQTQVLRSLYEVYPERFGNKTNGITPRRWLLGCNERLSAWIRARIGDDFLSDASALLRLKAYADDDAALDELLAIKQHNKARLCAYLRRTHGIELQPDAVFDVQIKRLHEYKRQQLAALYLIDRLLAIREGKTFSTPVAAIFGAKAAPSYVLAKDILHLLLCLQEVTLRDARLREQLRVAVVENYNVSAAEMLVPACDISEQISLASKEASGTGNMKLMMNGALTLGTLDGANVEIASLVGKENVYLFGATGEEVVALERARSYEAQRYYQSDTRLRRAVDFLLSEELCAIGDAAALARLHEELTLRDRFMTLMDFRSYCDCHDRALEEYADRRTWARKMLWNIAHSGYFSSDRTVAEYNRDIWKLKGDGRIYESEKE